MFFVHFNNAYNESNSNDNNHHLNAQIISMDTFGHLTLTSHDPSNVDLDKKHHNQNFIDVLNSSEESNSGNENDQNQNTTTEEKYAIIIGSVIGGSILILVVVVFLIWYRKRKLAIEAAKVLETGIEETQIHEYEENIDDHLTHVYNVHSNEGLCDEHSNFHIHDHKHFSRTNSDVITEYSGEYSASNNLEGIPSFSITQESPQPQRLHSFLSESTSFRSFTESSFNYSRQETPSYHAASTPPASWTSKRAPSPDIPSDRYPIYTQSRRTAMTPPTCSQSAYSHIHTYNSHSAVSDSTPDSKRTSSESLALYLAMDMI